MKQFIKGQKVKNQYGEVLTVMKQTGCQVYVYENCGEYYHPSKLVIIK